MKDINEITRLSAEDLERISLDGKIPVPEDLSVRLPGRNTSRILNIAAAAALLIGVGVAGYLGTLEPRDTFDDPYMAYAAVEKALNKMSGTIQYGAQKVTESEMVIDNLSYWK